MQFTRLRLRQFKCFKDIDVQFTDGATVIHGVNGSGKSSLLEACFFALYGTDSLPAGRNLEAIVTKDHDECEIELWFEHAGQQYQVERNIKITDSQVIHDGILTTPQGRLTGITAIEDAIEELLRMNADAFLNCAYVRQGDITRLLSASPSERQGMIDDLLQLGKLESYRDRMDLARRGVDRVRRDRAAKLEDVQDSIETLEAKNLDSQLGAIAEDITAKEERHAELAAAIEEATAELETIRDALEEASENEAELDEVKRELSERRDALDAAKDRRSNLMADRNDLRSSLEAKQSEIESRLDALELEFEQPVQPATVPELRPVVEDAHATARDAVDAIEEEIATVRETAQAAAAESQRLDDKADTLETQATDYEDRREDLEEDLEAKATELEAKEQQLTEKRETIDRHRKRFAANTVPENVEFGDAAAFLDRLESDLDDHRDDAQTVIAEITALSQQIEHAERLIEEGKCPECGQDIEGAPEVASLEDDRHRLAELTEERETIEEEIAAIQDQVALAKELKEVEATVRQLKSECTSLEALIEEQRAAVSDKRETAEAAAEQAAAKREEARDRRAQAAERAAERDDHLERLEQLQAQETEATERVDQLTGLTQLLDAIEQLDDRIHGVSDQLRDVDSLIEEHEAAVAELESREADLAAAVEAASIEALEADQERVTSRLEDAEAEREAVESALEALRERRGEVRNERKRLESLTERAATLEAQVTALSDVVAECAAIQDVYAALRTDLRRQNVRHLEVLLNEIFTLVYQNDAYARIELSEEYELAVIEKSGAVLAPAELSGGEKALFNLSLRCAIYQLLAEGIGPEAPLPPLILDEPTVHLDAEHINQIGALVDRMRRLGVDQTIVVSHEPEIVDRADERMEVIQNPSTNRSEVNVESSDLLAGLAD